jgi:phytoene dehydrogenase-like protein
VVVDQPEIDLAHPLDDGSAGVVQRSLEATVSGLGADGGVWRDLIGPPAAHFGELLDELMQPVLHWPSHPVLLARFGLHALRSARSISNRFSTAQGAALWAGLAAHVCHPLEAPTSASVGLMLGASAHGAGWVVARGGSQAIADAMASALRELGGAVHTSSRVRSLDDLDAADITMMDLSPSGALQVAGRRMSPRTRKAFERWQMGPGAFKVDLAIEGDVPWTNEAARRAGTVHVGGTYEEVAAAERDVATGKMPARPFVLVGQQYLADRSRSVGTTNPVWAYAHVPRGYDGDASNAILDQLERFAPGLRERILRTHLTAPSGFEEFNANFVDGDILTGANTSRQILMRPRAGLNPYRCGAKGLYLCSAATPPGAGAHGMGGFNAANAALREVSQ